MRKSGYLRIPIPTPQTDLEKEAVAFLYGPDNIHLQLRGNERLARLVMLYTLWLEQQQIDYQKVSGE